MADVAANLAHEIADRGEDAASQQVSFEFREPEFPGPRVERRKERQRAVPVVLEAVALRSTG